MTYMQRVRENADSILQRQIGALEAKTVDPKLCPVMEDKVMMHERQADLEALKSNLKDVRKGGFWGNLIAFSVAGGPG